MPALPSVKDFYSSSDASGSYHTQHEEVFPGCWWDFGVQEDGDRHDWYTSLQDVEHPDGELADPLELHDWYL